MSSTTVNALDPLASTPIDDKSLYSKITWRLLPILFVSYGVNYIDRVNIGYAKLQMLQDLSWSDAIFGLGAGIFFVGYLAFEIPSNMLLERIGARKTLLRIMFGWGIVSAAMMFVTTPMQFYIVRFLQGSFEAGFFPGVVLFLTYWYPKQRRGRVIAKFMIAIPVSGIIAGPVSGAVLQFMNGINGWHGWQWLYLTEGLPASILGVIAYLFLTDRPEQASWLTQQEKAHVREQLHAETTHPERARSHAVAEVLQVLKDPVIWVLSGAYVMTQGGDLAVLLMMPTIIKSWGVPSLFMVGVYSAIPYIASAIGMLAFGASSDRFNERRWHYLVAILTSLLGIVLIFVTRGHFIAQLMAMSLTMFGLLSNASLMFALVTDLLPTEEAAPGIATVSAIGNVGSVFMPSVAAAFVAMTGDPSASYYPVFVVFAIAALLVTVAAPAAARHQSAASAIAA
jgi:MFS family permease